MAPTRLWVSSGGQPRRRSRTMALRSKVFTYGAELTWQGGHSAVVAAGDRPSLPVAPPPDFPGGDDEHWSPEHIFLAALESCTMLSFLAHCAHHDLEVREYSARATGSIERREDDHRYAFTHVEVVVRARDGAGAGRGGPRADREGGARLLHHRLDDRPASRTTGGSWNERARPLGGSGVDAGGHARRRRGGGRRGCATSSPARRPTSPSCSSRPSTPARPRRPPPRWRTSCGPRRSRARPARRSSARAASSRACRR